MRTRVTVGALGVLVGAYGAWLVLSRVAESWPPPGTTRSPKSRAAEKADQNPMKRLKLNGKNTACPG